MPGIMESFHHGAELWPLVLITIAGGAIAVATFYWWRRRKL